MRSSLRREPRQFVMTLLIVLVGLSVAGCDLLFPSLGGGGSATPVPSSPPMPCGDGAPQCQPQRGLIQLTVTEPSGAAISAFEATYAGAEISGSFDFQSVSGAVDLEVPLGPLMLTVTSAGHQDAVRQVMVVAGTPLTLTVVLAPVP